jgi:hypothetical protein
MDLLDGDFTIKVSGYAIEELYRKFGGKVHVKIMRPQSEGTDAQNKAMHVLLMEYYATGLHSSPEGTTLDKFKWMMKIAYGPCYEGEIKGKKYTSPKSWSDYTKMERADFIDKLISEIHQSGAFNESSKIREIIDGMSISKREGCA